MLFRLLVRRLAALPPVLIAATGGGGAAKEIKVVRKSTAFPQIGGHSPEKFPRSSAASYQMPFSFESKPGDIFTWAEVSVLHKSRNGIYQSNGELISLLTDFGRINPCYPDFHGDSANTIHYTGSGRRGDQKLDAANRALHSAIGTPRSVPLFNKLGVNRWEFLGEWIVTEANYVFDETRERMVWRFTLVRAL